MLILPAPGSGAPSVPGKASILNSIGRFSVGLLPISKLFPSPSNEPVNDPVT